MPTEILTPDAPKKSAPATPADQGASKPAPKTLAAVVQCIVRDSHVDSIHYLLRSNTSHDGE